MTGCLLGSVSSIPSSKSSLGLSLGAMQRRGGEAVPSKRLADAMARAQYAWARRYAPWLLQEWANG